MNLIHNTNSNSVEKFKQKQVNTAWATTMGMQCAVQNWYTSQMLNFN